MVWGLEGALLPPSSVTDVEDEDGQREEEAHSSDGEEGNTVGGQEEC